MDSLQVITYCVFLTGQCDLKWHYLVILVLIGENAINTHGQDALLTEGLYWLVSVTFTGPLCGDNFGQRLLDLKALTWLWPTQRSRSVPWSCDLKGVISVLDKACLLEQSQAWVVRLRLVQNHVQSLRALLLFQIHVQAVIHLRLSVSALVKEIVARRAATLAVKWVLYLKAAAGLSHPQEGVIDWELPLYHLHHLLGARVLSVTGTAVGLAWQVSWGEDCLAALGTAIGEAESAWDARLAEGVAAVNKDLGQASRLIVVQVTQLAFHDTRLRFLLIHILLGLWRR